MAILRSFKTNYDVRKYLIQKAFHDDEEWVSEDFVKVLERAATAVRIDVDVDDIAGWYDNSPHEPNPDFVWHVVFHGFSPREVAAAKAKGAKEDEAEDQGLVFVAFYMRLKDGMLYKIETETAH